MDSRSKIKTWEQLRPELAEGGWKVLAGTFDPLTPATAARITSVSEGSRKLLVVIRSEEDSLFDSAARAQLVAALRGVDAVMIEESQDWRVLSGGNSEAMVTDDADECVKRRQEFEQLVLNRTWTVTK